MFQANTSDRNRVWWPYLLFGVTALNVLTWFPKGAPIGWGDAGFLAYAAFPRTLLHVAAHPWNPLRQLGNPGASLMSLLPRILWYYGASLLGLPPAAAQGCEYWLIQFVSMAAMYRVLCNYFSIACSMPFAAVAGALFYNFNPLALQNYWMIGNGNMELLALLPLLLLVVQRSFAQSVGRTAGELSLVLVGCLNCFENPAYAVPVLSLAGLWWIITARSIGGIEGCRALRFTSATVLGVGTVAWYVLPSLLQTQSYYRAASSDASPVRTLIAADQNVNWLSLLSFRAFRTNSPAYAPFWAPQWRFFFSSPVGRSLAVALGLIIVLGAVAQLRRLWSMSLLLAAGLVLCAGGNPPFGSGYWFLFRHVPFFAAFRDPTNKWAPLVLLSGAVLFASGVAFLVRWLSARAAMARIRWRAFLAVAAIAGLVLFNSQQMWLGGPGDFGFHVPGVTIKRGIVIPKAYLAVRHFLLARPGSFRVLVVPLDATGERWLRWRQGYAGADLSWLQFGVPALASAFGQNAGLGGHILSGMITEPPAKQLAVAGHLSCRYVVLEKDAAALGLTYATPPPHSARSYKSALVRSGAKLVFSAGPVMVYELRSRFVTPMLQLRNVIGDQSVLTRDVRLSADGGEITVRAGSVPGVLEFAQAFDPHWLASLGIPGRGIVEWRSLRRHFEYDGFGNAWYVPGLKKFAGRMVTIRLQYSDAQVVTVGDWVSLVALLLIVLLFLAGERRPH